MTLVEEYQDIINLSHHISKKHPQMSVSDRAAQFAPFAALTGYEAVIKETARRTDSRIEMDEYSQAELEGVLGVIKEQTAAQPWITVTYFVPDRKKEGGAYVTISGRVKKIDEYKQKLILMDETEIWLYEIISIELGKESK